MLLRKTASLVPLCLHFLSGLVTSMIVYAFIAFTFGTDQERVWKQRGTCLPPKEDLHPHACRSGAA